MLLRRARGDGTGVNHSLWVISYADMVTLLFALFVVLYSLGEVKLSRLRELRQSLASAFGRGDDRVDDDLWLSDPNASGRRPEGLRLLFSQDAAMRQLLLRTLPRRFEELTGARMEVDVDHDEIAFTAPLRGFYAPGAVDLEPATAAWLGQLVDAALSFTTRVHLDMVAPNVVIRTDEAGRAVRPAALSLERLERLLRTLPLFPRVLVENVDTQFRYSLERATDWEGQGTLRIAFSSR